MNDNQGFYEVAEHDEPVLLFRMQRVYRYGKYIRERRTRFVE
jgi:hypothetical protein